MKQASKLYQMRRRRWIVARYLFVIAVILLMILALTLPSLQFSTSATGKAERISAATLTGNAWSSVREVLFGGAEQLSATVRFSRSVLTVLIFSVVLFLIGVGASLWGAIGAIRSITEATQSKNERALWLTLFPNRVALWLWKLPLLPLLAFPRILVILYAVLLGNESVRLKAGILDPLLIGLLLLLADAILSAVSATKERVSRIDPFPSQKSEDDAQAEEDGYGSLLNSRADVEALRHQREQQVLEFRRILNREQEPPSQDNE